MIYYFIAAMLATFGLTALIARFLIPKLKSMKLGQQILDIGPRWHKSKEGTPTMGGLSFIIASLLVFVVLAVVMTVGGAAEGLEKLIIVIVMAALNGAIGVVDDLTKFKNHRNEGLSASQKFLLQLIVAALYLFALSYTGFINTVMPISFTNIGLDLKIVYYPMALIVITGIINSVNLTDGIDGLASSVTMVVGAAFAVLSFFKSDTELSFLSSMIIGACLGFLVYNFYPARIFMGDTGSLFLGAAAVGCAFIINDPLIILIIGIVYVAESLSVIIQVGSFKLTGKRIFKMSPIHHHFEKCGWSEIKIVSVFSFVTFVFSAIAVILSVIK